MTESAEIRDRRGYPIHVGDVLKVYHFTDARRKRHFMYKFVAESDGLLYAVCASAAARAWHAAHRCRLSFILPERMEIVQGYGPGDIISYEDRPRVKVVSP